MSMIHFFTDFGWQGPYVGQMRAAVYACPHANGIPVVDLMHDAPKHDPRAAAYLLAALAGTIAPGDVCVGVVDPGVGTEREPIILNIDGRYFVGPDNGLFDITARHARKVEAFRITWRPDALSASFHGRDLFAPVAAMFAGQKANPAMERNWQDRLAQKLSGFPKTTDWPDDLDEVIYIDVFGNCMTGRRAETADAGDRFHIGSASLDHARTFGEVPVGEAFWYENSLGLVEIAVNQGSAAARFGLVVGASVVRSVE